MRCVLFLASIAFLPVTVFHSEKQSKKKNIDWKLEQIYIFCQLASLFFIFLFSQKKVKIKLE